MAVAGIDDGDSDAMMRAAAPARFPFWRCATLMVAIARLASADSTSPPTPTSLGQGSGRPPAASASPAAAPIATPEQTPAQGTQALPPASAQPADDAAARIHRIKAAVEEALRTPRAARGTDVANLLPDRGTADARRQQLQRLVGESRPTDNVQEAGYVAALRDEVSATVVFGGATAPSPTAPANRPIVDAAPPDGYRVQRGDSLWTIAKARFGDGYRWKAIYDANRAALRHSNSLTIGQVLKMPER